MRLLFDQNLSHRLVAQLAAEFPGSAHVRDAGLASASDPVVWSYAAANGLILVSKDTDFQQRALLYGHPPKVIWVRSGNGPTAAVAALLRSRLADIARMMSDILECNTRRDASSRAPTDAAFTEPRYDLSP